MVSGSVAFMPVVRQKQKRQRARPRRAAFLLADRKEREGRRRRKTEDGKGKRRGGQKKGQEQTIYLQGTSPVTFFLQ